MMNAYRRVGAVHAGAYCLSLLPEVRCACDYAHASRTQAGLAPAQIGLLSGVRRPSAQLVVFKICEVAASDPVLGTALVRAG